VKEKQSDEFRTFDQTMRGLLAVPYSELQQKLKSESREKSARKKKRPKSAVSSRASASGKKRVA
jgi:hypothetical protein